MQATLARDPIALGLAPSAPDFAGVRHPRRRSKSDQIESNHRAPIAGTGYPATPVANSKCGISYLSPAAEVADVS